MASCFSALGPLTGAVTASATSTLGVRSMAAPVALSPGALQGSEWYWPGTLVNTLAARGPLSNTAGLAATVFAGTALGPFGNVGGMLYPGNDPGAEAFLPQSPVRYLWTLGPRKVDAATAGSTAWSLVASLPAPTASGTARSVAWPLVATLPTPTAFITRLYQNRYPAAASLPAPTASAGWLRGSNYTNGGITLPMPTASAGWNRGRVWTIAATVPAFTATGQVKISKQWPLTATLPVPTVHAGMAAATQWPVAAVLQPPTAHIDMGFKVAATLPAPTAAVGWLHGKVWPVAATLPALAVDGSHWQRGRLWPVQAQIASPTAALGLEVAKLWSITATLPALSAQIGFGRNRQWPVAATLPSPVAASGWQRGRSWPVAAHLPAPSASVAAQRLGVWPLTATLPAFRATALVGSPVAATIPAPVAALVWRQGRSWPVAATLPRLAATATFAAPWAGATVAAYALNTETFAPTQYAQFPFVALGSVGGVPFGATATAVYWLDGDDDDGTPIACTLLSGQSDFGDNRLKRVPIVHADIDGAARINVEMDGVRSNYAFGKRALLPQGLAGNRWAFGVQNVAGSKVTVRSLQPEIQPLIRRFK